MSGGGGGRGRGAPRKSKDKANDNGKSQGRRRTANGGSNAEATARPQRTNQGQGGRAVQLERAFDIAAQPTQTKRTAFAASAEMGDNAFAPTERLKRARPSNVVQPPPPPPPAGLSRGTFTLPPGVNPSWMQGGAQQGPGVSNQPAQPRPQYNSGPQPGPQQGHQYTGGAYPQQQQQYAQGQGQRQQYRDPNYQQQGQFNDQQSQVRQGEMPTMFDTNHGPNDPAYQQHMQQQQRQHQEQTNISDSAYSRFVHQEQQRQRQQEQTNDGGGGGGGGGGGDEEDEEEDFDGPGANGPLMDGADDAPFDDLSPDEDERRAQDYLRGPTTGSAPQIQDDFAVDPRLTSGTSENPAQGYSRDDDESVTGSAPVNVLQKHWDRNRPPRIPNPQNMLLQPRPFSRSGSSASGSLTRAPSPSPSAASEPSNSRSGSRSRSKSKSRASQSRAPRNSRNAPTADNAKPTQLRYYREAPRWYRALTKSKDLFAVYIYSECGFPTSTVADMEAGHCLKEGKRIVMEEEDEELESDFDDTKDMIKLTTDVGSSCRGDLKSFIRKIIISGYNLIPALTDVNEKTGKRYTAEERVAFCVNRVKELQKDGNWLNSGEGTDGNINHPVIEDTIRDFFYAEDGIALKYPQFFEDEVPVRTVVLVAIAVYNCLDEMQTGKLKTIKFEADRYHTKYLEILDSVQKVLEAPAAGPIYQEQLRDWASGRKAATTSASTSSLGIRLNLG